MINYKIMRIIYKTKTPKQRLRVYKKMLQIITETDYVLFGFCNILCWHPDFNLGFYSTVLNNCPELMNQRPERKYRKTNYWWKPGDKRPRIKALKAAIKLIEDNE
jgi:hypothetical protein